MDRIRLINKDKEITMDKDNILRADALNTEYKIKRWNGRVQTSSDPSDLQFALSNLSQNLGMHTQIVRSQKINNTNMKKK